MKQTSWLIIGALFGALVGTSVPSGTASAGPLVDALLKSENFKVRLRAAAALASQDEADGARALRKALEDEHPLVRAAAAHSLGRRKDSAALPAICPLRVDSEEFVRRTAVAALASLGGEAACEGREVRVRLDVTGADEGLRQVVQAAFHDLASTHQGLVWDDEKPAVELKLALRNDVVRSETETRVRCEMAGSVFEVGSERKLRASGTRNAEVVLGSARVDERAVSAESRGCAVALVGPVYDGFRDYLRGAAPSRP